MRGSSEILEPRGRPSIEGRPGFDRIKGASVEGRPGSLTIEEAPIERRPRSIRIKEATSEGRPRSTSTCIRVKEDRVAPHPTLE